MLHPLLNTQKHIPSLNCKLLGDSTEVSFPYPQYCLIGCFTDTRCSVMFVELNRGLCCPWFWYHLVYLNSPKVFFFLFKYAWPGRSKNKLMILLSSSKPVIMVNSQLSMPLEKHHWRESHTRSTKTWFPSVFDMYCMIFKELICLVNFVWLIGLLFAFIVSQ